MLFAAVSVNYLQSVAIHAVSPKVLQERLDKFNNCDFNKTNISVQKYSIVNKFALFLELTPS